MAKAGLQLLRDAYRSFSADKAMRLAAALSYYTIFSLPPLLVLAIAVASVAYSEEAARGSLVEQFRGLIGERGAQAVNAMILRTARPESSVPATIVGLGLLMLGATGVFIQLQEALNTVWEVRPKPTGGVREFVKRLLKVRLTSLMVVLSFGFLLLVSLVLTAALSAFAGFMGGLFPWPRYVAYVLQGLELAVSFGVITLLFAAIFKILPDAEIAWRDVWVGAAITSGLFSVGKLLIGLYLGRTAAASVYGAAGSLVVIMLWVFYSSNILLFGAEFTRAYADRYGSRIRPAPYAERLTPAERARRGMEPGKGEKAA